MWLKYISHKSQISCNNSLEKTRPRLSSWRWTNTALPAKNELPMSAKRNVTSLENFPFRKISKPTVSILHLGWLRLGQRVYKEESAKELLVLKLRSTSVVPARELKGKINKARQTGRTLSVLCCFSLGFDRDGLISLLILLHLLMLYNPITILQDSILNFMARDCGKKLQFISADFHDTHPNGEADAETTDQWTGSHSSNPMSLNIYSGPLRTEWRKDTKILVPI